MASKAFEELKSLGSLPSPIGVGFAVLDITRRDDGSIEDLIRAIHVDPAITARILRVANSPLMGGAEQITSLRDAAVRLGTRTLSNLALGFSVIGSNRDGLCQGFDYERCWSLSLAHAVAAQALAKRFGAHSPAQAFTCALLSRIGQLGLASAYPREYTDILQRAGGLDSAERLRLESEVFCINHHEVTEGLLSEWGFPEAFCAAAGGYWRKRDSGDIQDAGLRELTQALLLGEAIAEFMLASPAERPQCADALARAGFGQSLGDGELARLIESLAVEWAEWGRMLSVPTAQLGSIELALQPPPASAAEAEQPALGAETRSGIRVLAVDDDPVSLRLLVRHLQRAGYSVITATDGYQGLLAAMKHAPQIIVADWMMPKMDGIDLCKALRRFDAGRKVYMLLLTGRDSEDRIVEAFDAGVNDYISKPFKPRLLLARVGAGQRMVEMQAQVEREKAIHARQSNDLAILSRKLRDMANRDVLTGLANRRCAMEQLTQCWQQGQAASGQLRENQLSVIALDIDHFKRVNDGHGHDAGDAILKEVADCLARSTRPEDVCARMGGEEFLVICRNTPLAGGLAFAERLRSSVATHLIAFGGFRGSVTISAGVAEREAGMRSVDELLKRADLALYRAKSLGRNRVEAWRAGESEARSA